MMKARNSNMLALLAMLSVSAMYAQTKNLQQFVQNWPAGYDTTGKHWTIYQYFEPKTHFLTETSVGSFTLHDGGANVILWNANLGNFNGSVNPWAPGDTITIIGSIDTAYISNPAGYGDNPNHCGFYWLYSDTISQATPQLWLPDDTLHALPQPIASQAGPNIQISITNPNQTVSNINVFSVLGYWLWADTSGTGSPAAYDKEIMFIPVSGGPGETTIHFHPISGNYVEGETVVWAYYLVAAPDTGGTSCPGHATQYLSRNSNPLVIVGIEESTRQQASLTKNALDVRPNPFMENLSISFKIAASEPDQELCIHSADGRLIASFEISGSSSRTSSIIWDGKHLSAGTYFVILRVGTSILCEKATKLR